MPKDILLQHSMTTAISISNALDTLYSSPSLLYSTFQAFKNFKTTSSLFSVQGNFGGKQSYRKDIQKITNCIQSNQFLGTNNITSSIGDNNNNLSPSYKLRLSDGRKRD